MALPNCFVHTSHHHQGLNMFDVAVAVIKIPSIKSRRFVYVEYLLQNH